VFHASGWQTGPGTGVNQGAYSIDPIGLQLQVTLNQGEVAARRIPVAAKILTHTLAQIGLIDGNNAFASPDAPVDRIILIIGRKPPPK
jgi:hypothetical protein